MVLNLWNREGIVIRRGHVVREVILGGWYVLQLFLHGGEIYLLLNGASVRFFNII